LQNDGEVDDGCFASNLGRVVRVVELGRFVEPEIVVVLDLIITKLHDWYTSCPQTPAYRKPRQT